MIVGGNGGNGDVDDGYMLVPTMVVYLYGDGDAKV